MSTQQDLIAHVHAVSDGLGGLVADNAIACKFINAPFPGLGNFAIQTSPGMGSENKSAKATINTFGLSFTINSFASLFDDVFLVFCQDAAGNPVNPVELWTTVERIPRVG